MCIFHNKLTLEDIRIAGIELKRNGFRICKFCGKVQKQGMNPRKIHDSSCSAQNKDDESVFEYFCYFYLTAYPLDTGS